MKRLLAFLFALVIATPAAAEPVTPATFDAALAAAQGGETLELATGDYGNLSLSNMTFPSDVTIVSADPANPAIISGLIVSNSSHLVFDGILFDHVAGGDFRPFWVQNSTFITILNSVFDGDEVLSASGTGEFGVDYGLHVTDSGNIAIENNEIYDFNRGIVIYRTSNLVVRANDLHSFSSDALNFTSGDGLLIEGNWIHDFKIDPTTGAHPDMIQLWTVLGDMASQNVTIRGNFIDAGNGDLTQSIFMGTGLVGGTDFDDVWKNLLIENNVIYNAHLHGITIGEANGLVIRNNTLLYDGEALVTTTWAAGGQAAPRINPNAASVNVTIESNILQQVWNWDDVTGQPGWIVGNNLHAQWNAPNDPGYYGDLFVNPFALDATLADLRALAGGVIEADVTGAEMTRADITLVTGPFATAPPPDPGVCEALLADALALLDDVGVLLVSMTNERDVAVADGEATLVLLAAMTIQRDLAVASLSDANAALVDMTVERDAALQSESAALADLETAQTQLAVEVAKIAAILVIVEGN